MKCLLIVVALLFTTGCGTTQDGRKTFLGLSAYKKDFCVDQWTVKKRKIIYRKCFK